MASQRARGPPIGTPCMSPVFRVGRGGSKLAVMTETESKWAERVREWKSTGQSAPDYVQGRGFEASTLRAGGRAVLDAGR